MMQSTPFIELIRESTATLHEKLETNFDLFNRAKNVSAYVDVLERFQAFYAAVEPRLLELAQDPRLSDLRLPERMKAEALRQDLADLRTSDTQAAARPALDPNRIPRIDDAFAALGVLYVLEGSTLGGQVITRHFLKTMPELTTDRGLRFFNGYGPKTREMWVGFIQTLEAIGTQMTDAEKQRVGEVAKDTFAGVEHALCSTH